MTPIGLNDVPKKLPELEEPEPDPIEELQIGSIDPTLAVIAALEGGN